MNNVKPIHLFLGEGTTLAICARVFAETVEDQTSESFATATSALSTSGFSKESISPLDVTTTLLLPDMVRGNSKCELQRDNERHVEWSECQPKLEFVKIASNGSHLEVSTSITYDASIGTEEAPKLRRGSRVRKQFVHRFQLEQSRVNSEHMSADSIVFALMTSLSDLSITQEEIQAEISAGFIEGDSIGSQDSGVSWHPSSDGHSSLSHTLTQRCLDGTHSILFEKAPGAGSLHSVGISPLELVHLDNLQCTPAEMETSSMVFTPVEAPDSELPVLGCTNLLFTDKTMRLDM